MATWSLGNQAGQVGMTARDRISEILAVRQRAGRAGPSPSKWDLEALAGKAERLKEIGDTVEFIPIRIVTILEVFLRSWIERLVDQGMPYLQRAAKLKIDLKFDLVMVGNVHDGVVTLGQLIAHSVSLNRVETIGSIFGELLDENFFDVISTARDRWSIEVEGKPDLPIIDNIEGLLRTLSRLFTVRHVLVHERPQKKSYESAEIDDFLSCAVKFAQATDEVLLSRLYGSYPLTQREMNRRAAEQYNLVEGDLEKVCAEIAATYQSNTIYDVQKAWKIFLEAESSRQAEWVSGGSMYSMVYHSAAETLTRARVDDLRRWIDEAKVD
jgi:hypothetical protein